MSKSIRHIIVVVLLTCVWSCKKEGFVLPDYIMEEFVDLGTHQLSALTHGTGEHTVIFENGLGTNMRVWFESEIVQTIGNEAEAIAYNRAGTKKSTVGPDPRDLPTLMEDLHQLILALSENEKVILVGHSLGGAIIRSYAIAYPHKVEGICFVEASHEEFLRLSEDDERGLISEIKKRDDSRLGTIQEAAQIIENAAYLRSLPNLPDIPVIVLTSVKLEEGLSETYVKRWSEVQRSLGEGVSDFTQIETSKSGHNIHTEEPELVIQSVRTLMNK